MTGARGVLVVGNGPAAVRLTHALRHNDYPGPITVIGRRPATQRAVLTSIVDGRLPAGSVALPAHPDGVRVHLGVNAVRIDRRGRLVHTERGACAYDALVLATGSRPRLPPLPGLLEPCGQLADGATTLHSTEDTTRITGGHAIVLGAGPLGVEAALALRRSGRDVTVICPGSHPLPEHLDAVAGRLLAEHLDERGIALQPGRSATEYTPGKITLDNGHVIDVDTLLVCAGDVPRTRLAAEAGLPVRHGILVDAHLRTADPHISAIGGCAEPGPAPGTGPAAEDQAGALAARLACGAGLPSPPVAVRLRDPELDVAAYGSLSELDTTAEQITLRDPANRRYARLALRDERVTAAVLIGLPHGIATVGRLHRHGHPVPTDRLALLLGTTPRTTAPAEPPDDAVVCRCNHVTKRALVEAWQRGARDLPRLADATRAKLVLSTDGRTLHGGVLVGEVGSYPLLTTLVGKELSTSPDLLMRPA